MSVGVLSSTLGRPSTLKLRGDESSETLPARSVCRATTVCGPEPSTVLQVHAPVPSAVTEHTRAAPSKTLTVANGSAVPVSAGCGATEALVVGVLTMGEGGAVFTVYGRDGSRGLGLARDHRLGVRASGSLGPVTGMVEGLAAWGVDGDALRQPLGGSASLVARPFGPLLAYVRLDLSTEAWGDSEAGTRTVLAGAGVELPDMDAPPLRLIAGYSGTRVGDGVAAIAGASALQDADMVFLQVGVTLGVASTCSNPSCSPR